MYLEKLEIQGFKSFANKNVLVFPGMLDKTKRGITAVVGPNGCGKSNIADSVRWALGEQSMKTLRGKKSEDVIFSGSDKKGQLGMAEVSLHLNNESRQAPIDYSEVVITRRLFRNGDSEYLINNSRARLSDIQMLLAKAKFGQKTYSVIGQGMVEGFLNTSLTERKEFFDEATGVKQYQIKRDDSLNKLRSSYENLNQTSMILSEIEPRLKNLTRQVNKLRKRDETETELKTIQADFYSHLWHDIHNKFKEHNARYLEIEKLKMDKDKKIENLTRELSQMEKEANGASEFSGLQSKLSEAQSRKDNLTRQIAKIEATLELKLEAQGKFDISWLVGKSQEIKNGLIAIEEEISGLEGNISPEKQNLERLSIEIRSLENSIKNLNEKLLSAKTTINENDLKRIQASIEESLSALDSVADDHGVDMLRNIIMNVKNKLRDILGLAAKKPSEENADELHDKLRELNESKEELLLQISDTNLRISARTERVKLLKENRNAMQRELEGIEAKKQNTSEKNEDNGEERERLQAELASINEEITGIKDRIGKTSQEEQVRRSRLFELQKTIQATQDEINSYNNELGQIKIHSTRYETKLEDLEAEIRQSYGDIKAIREHECDTEIDIESSREKINSLKRQLDMIGGIDPEVEKEYTETQERFDFLSGQVNDLDKAIQSLEKVIKELDLTIREQFDKEFNVIAKKFSEYFKILFNGGSAKIVKVMENERADMEPDEIGDEGEEKNSEKANKANKAEAEASELVDLKKIKFLQKHNATGLAGIEIQAVPPGKKIRSISMLSGGERAMTAIALICAIISANPSPFVILDEVDAALDEANSERLAKILDDLSHRTQFIVVTHNRASMRKANILYGVTMGDDGVSKLLSIKLEEASEVIAKN